MQFENVNVGFALTGSFCTFDIAIKEIEKLKKEGANVIPIMSFNAFSMDTKFGEALEFKEKIETLTNNEILHTIQQVEPIGPKSMLDILVILPCSGNTIGKLANGINDTPVTMATKSHLRNDRPVVLGISTNDALSGEAKNIGILLNTKNYYFIPFNQDNPIAKPRSMVCKFDLLIPTLKEALNQKQIEPIIYK